MPHDENGTNFTSLSPDQIENPLSVLADFFSDDWLPGHLERLKDWRRCIISDEYFKGDKGSPAELLYFHQLNVTFIEALYILKDSQNSLGEQLFPQQLATEKENWRDFPVMLDEVYLLKPASYLIEFFKDYSLQEYRVILYEWLENGLSSKACDEFINMPVLIEVYERLQLAYNVAWLIHQRTNENPYLKDGSKPDLINNNDNSPMVCNLYQLDQEITAEKQEILSQIVSMVKHKVPSTEAIIYLGLSPGEFGRHYLLVLTDNNEKEPAQGLSTCIEESCAKVANMVALTHHISKAVKPNQGENVFFAFALACPILYLAGHVCLPSPTRVAANLVAQPDRLLWQSWNEQGNNFLKGAEFYLSIGAAEPALYSLQQCAECLLIAIIRGVLGYRFNNHNLKTLINITQMFTGVIAELFNLQEDDAASDFRVLQHAYVNVRYKDGYAVDGNVVSKLYPVICELSKLIENLYRQHVHRNTL